MQRISKKPFTILFSLILFLLAFSKGGFYTDRVYADDEYENGEEVGEETEAETEEEGIVVGDNVKAFLDEEGKLTISGDGAIGDNVNYIVNPGNHSIKMGEKMPYFQEIRNRITEIKIEEGVTSIGRNAFQIYTKQLDIPKTQRIVFTIRGGLPALTKIDFGPSVSAIGENAFARTPELEKVVIPGNVKTIEKSAFEGSGLKEVVLEEGVEDLGDRVFAKTKLSDIVIPGSVKEIRRETFRDSTLGSVTIHQGTRTIHPRTFINVTARIYSKNVSLLEESFVGVNTKFYCLKGSTAEKYAKKHGFSISYLSDVPKKAVSPKLSSKNGKLTVTCKKMNGVDGYQIRYSTSSGMRDGDTETVKEGTLKLVGLKKGKTYYVKVRGYLKRGKKTLYGGWSRVSKITIK